MAVGLNTPRDMANVCPSYVARGNNWSLTFEGALNMDLFKAMWKHAADMFPAKKIVFFKWQEEIGEQTGMEHIQAMCCYEKGYRPTFQTVKKDMIGTPHIELARDPDKLATYVWKEDTRKPGGEQGVYGVYPGKALVFKDPAMLIKENAKEHAKDKDTKRKSECEGDRELAKRLARDEITWFEIIEEHPEYADRMARINNMADIYRKEFAKQEAIKEAKENFDCLFQWQICVYQYLQMLDERAKTRQVHVFVDEGGNTGKSFLATALQSKYRTLYLDGGKTRDITYNASKMQPGPELLLLDVPKRGMQYVPWHTLEKMMSGRFNSDKYHSTRVHWSIKPMLVVFANEDPPLNKLSMDRWVITTIIPGCKQNYLNKDEIACTGTAEERLVVSDDEDDDISLHRAKYATLQIMCKAEMEDLLKTQEKKRSLEVQKPQSQSMTKYFKKQ